MADMSYYDPGREFGQVKKAQDYNPWYVRLLVSLGVVKNKTQAGYVLLALALVGVFATFFLWPETTYKGPDPSGEPDPTRTR